MSAEEFSRFRNPSVRPYGICLEGFPNDKGQIELGKCAHDDAGDRIDSHPTKPSAESHNRFRDINIEGWNKDLQVCSSVEGPSDNNKHAHDYRGDLSGHRPANSNVEGLHLFRKCKDRTLQHSFKR